MRDKSKSLFFYQYPFFEDPLSDIEKTNGEHMLIACTEVYERMKYHEDWNRLMPVLKKIMREEVESFSPSWSIARRIEKEFFHSSVDSVFELAVDFVKHLKVSRKQ